MRLVHDDGAEPALPEMAGAPAPCMNDAGIAAMHGRQRLAQAVGVGRHQNEMHVIGHQAPRPYLHLRGAAVLGEQIAIKRVIGVAEEGARAAVAALGDMVRIAGDDDAGETCHRSTMDSNGPDVN